MAQNFVKALPGGNGWSAGGYNFVVDDDGSFKYGKPDDSLSSASTSDFSQIVSTSKPTQRASGSALVIGDRWYKNDDGTQWFWNGTYWLSQPFIVGTHISVVDFGERLGQVNKGIFLHDITAKGRVASAPNWDSSNYWYVNSMLYGGGVLNNLAILNNTDGYVGGPDFHFSQYFSINQVVGLTPSTISGSLTFFVQVRSVGSPTSGGGGGSQLSYFFKLSYIFP